MKQLKDVQMIIKAGEFATAKHQGQERKYTGEPYVVHPQEVARIVSKVEPVGYNNSNLIAAALLHDVVEDTDTTLEEVALLFGRPVANIVEMVTDVSTLADGNRAFRKNMELEHIKKANWEGQTLKCADLISNTRSIVTHDPDFAVVYMKEKRRTLDAMKLADPRLMKCAWDIVLRYESGNPIHDDDFRQGGLYESIL
jgi:(p)ppGpp synthase/HD superfamily hydrolase